MKGMFIFIGIITIIIVFIFGAAVFLAHMDTVLEPAETGNKTKIKLPPHPELVNWRNDEIAKGNEGKAIRIQRVIIKKSLQGDERNE